MFIKYLLKNPVVSLRMKHMLNSAPAYQIINNSCSRVFYHTESGVYGYRPKLSIEQYKVNDDVIKRRAEQSNLYRFIEAFRTYGHREAALDPLRICKPTGCIELDSKFYGFSSSDSSQQYEVKGFFHHPTKEIMTLAEVESFLRKIYCGPIAFEFQHLPNIEEREWFAEEIERMYHTEITPNEKKLLLKEMLKSQVFDTFLATKFGSVKRYGGEGAETMLAFLLETMNSSVVKNIEQIILCIAHRGRLNLLTGLLEYPPIAMFHKVKGKSEFPLSANATGDVLSHLTSSVDLNVCNKSLHVTMLPNPSHLEAVNPVAVGKSRARQQSLRQGHYSNDSDSQMGDKVLCLQIHGDASFTAQGIIMETLVLSELPNFSVGGSLHLITNNQIGFTTPADRGRSSQYCSDVVKMIDIPIIHVNGDFPEAVVKAARLAVAYRQQFRRDVLVDLICYRRWGHNELDDPTLTNPLMYEAIHNRKSIPDSYAETLIKEGAINEKEVNTYVQEYTTFLNEQFSKCETYEPVSSHLQKQWQNIVQPSPNLTVWDTGVDPELLRFIGGKSVHIPDSFTLHSHLHKTFVQSRIDKLIEGKAIDWATAEAFAIGSLLYQGHNVRLSGQDVGRGTFSHRHMMLVDQKTNEIYEPLNHLAKNQMGFLEIANSPLSEEGVLGFEYGMSIENPNNLVIWEAQFGDFYNGAQIIIDTFITSGETKWLMQTGLVMLLPHGFDGAGPEHSSCHIERFLQLCDSHENGVDGDNVNIEIANPTTPAQYFHLLRRQIIRNFRKPLIVASPKILLRLPAAASSLSEFVPGKAFHPVISDSEVDPEGVKKVLFCSGKHYYTLAKQRKDLNAFDTAIVRLELLCPFPTHQLQMEMKKFSSASVFRWCQEEHQNMGCWSFVHPRFENLIGKKLSYVGRQPLAATAVGIGDMHKKEVDHILTQSFI